MKTYSSIWMLAAFALALGGCGTASQVQTPDAVYYSPTENQSSTATYRDSNGSDVTSDGTDQGQYVTYQDGDDGGYANDYNGLYSNAYNYGSYGLTSNYLSSPLYGYGYGYGLGWNPLAYSMPSLSLMFSMGYPWGRFYSPLAYGGYYSPYMYGGYYGGYGMYYPGYYSAYYPGYGYGYGYGGGKYLNVNPRPANSYGPRTSSNSRAAAIRGTSVSGNRAQGASAPRRTFGVSNRGETTRPVSSSTQANGRNSNVNSGTRRVFRVNPNERAVNLNTNTRVSNSRSAATPERTETNTRAVERQPAQRQVVERPQRTFEVQRSQPSYSQPSYSAPRSAPTRSFSPRGR